MEPGPTDWSGDHSQVSSGEMHQSVLTYVFTQKGCSAEMQNGIYERISKPVNTLYSEHNVYTTTVVVHFTLPFFLSTLCSPLSCPSLLSLTPISSPPVPVSLPGRDVKSVEVAGDTETHTLLNLQPDTEYIVTVIALYEANTEGPAATARFKIGTELHTNACMHCRHTFPSPSVPLSIFLCLCPSNFYLWLNLAGERMPL